MIVFTRSLIWVCTDLLVKSGIGEIIALKNLLMVCACSVLTIEHNAGLCLGGIQTH